MNHKGFRLLPLLVVATLSALLPLSIATGQVAGGKKAPPLLINVNGVMVEYVARAEALAAEKDYTGAIDILQSLLDRGEQCFVPTDDPRRFVSLAFKVREVIGRLGPEAERLYRGLYDARARRLFRAAAERLDEPVLSNLISLYSHTSSGNEALNLLGAILFDRGEFSSAACCWDRIIRAADKKRPQRPYEDKALLLAKIAVAHHFAGEAARAAKTLKLLVERHRQARTDLGGKEENVVAFVKRILAKSPPFADLCRVKGWPSFAGAPDSMAVMAPCRGAMSLRWTVPGGPIKDNPNLVAALEATLPVPSRFKKPWGRFMRSNSHPIRIDPTSLFKKPQVRFMRGGQIIYTTGTGGKYTIKDPILMLAVIHPVVVGTTVLYRSAASVVAHDLQTGEKLWDTPGFSLYRPHGTNPKLRGFYRLLYMLLPETYPLRWTGNLYARDLRGIYGWLPKAAADRGRWTLSAGGGRVFAVGRFLSSPLNSKSWSQSLAEDTSVLAAFSLPAQGRKVWQIGRGQGDTDLLRNGKFLGAPTYAAGRVYALLNYKQNHHIVCLNAENGRLVWETMVARVAVRTSGFGWYHSFLWARYSPPAVAAGKVFVVTNTGVAAAFDANTGRPIWAYLYDSNVNPISDRQIPRIVRESMPPSPNPVIVTGGKAICLPADCDKLLALRTDTGELEWSIDRRGQRDLTAINHSRLLLSGKGLGIIDAATGKNVWMGGKIAGIHGRPAVTTDAILASGKGEIIRVSLKDFSITRLPVKQPDAILGNLICVDGKLIAANAAGVSAYFPPPK